VVKKLFSLIFVAFLIAPMGLWLAGQMRGNGDNTTGQGFPLPEAALWSNREYYQSVEGWFQASLPISDSLKLFNNWLNYHLFKTTSIPAVHIGIQGWLYPGQASDAASHPSVDRQTGQRLFLDLHAVEQIIAATGKRFAFSVVPGKAALYPEYLGTNDVAVRHPVYRALMDANQRHPLRSLIDLEPELKKAKLSGVDVYGRQSLFWSCHGAAAAARQILADKRLDQPDSSGDTSVDCPAPDKGLYRLLLGQAAPAKAPLGSHVSGPHAVAGPSALIYGDSYLNHLLPFLTHAFNRIEIIDSDREPTFGPQILAAGTDIILLQRAEAGLRHLHLNLESLYASASQQMMGVVKRELSLEGATAVSHCALDITPDGLQIRSSGPQAFFSLPVPSGSTNNVFKMLELTFAPTHQGRITIRTHPNQTGLIQRALNRETHTAIVPLPFNDAVAIQINPSPHPGVFTLQRATLLNFYGNRRLSAPAGTETAPDDGDIYSGITIQPGETAAPAAPVQSPPPSVLHPTDELPDITLSDIQEGRIFQRRGKEADIVVTGTYTGVAGPVEARVVASGFDAVVVPWTVVDGTPENGLFTGILQHVPQGGWYQLQVRSRLTPWAVVSGSHRWAVGLLVACIGQSNMREWFYTGNDHLPSTHVMLHRDGKWHQPGATGNGALALGNRLAAELKLPIGLLDYSVNGTGLTAKADWGKGFWLDAGPNGIYRRLIDGVDATGGSVEYVLWLQGEADAAIGTVSREEYRKALERFVNTQIRADIKNGSTRPHLPFLIIPLVKRPSGMDIPCQWIRDAQMDALETIQECYLAALSIDLENRGRQHLAPASYSALGVRTAQTILYLLGKRSYHRGPVITAVTHVSAREIDVTMSHRGGTDFRPKTDITGFEVISGDKPLPIAGVRRIDGSTIRIALKADADLNFIVRYLYGAHPNTANPVRDNTDLRLPLEPYYR
jgi:hypothetical protein